MARRKTRVLFLIHSLYGGGAERSFLNVLAGLDREQFEPQLVLWENEGAYMDAVPGDVPLHVLPKTSHIVLTRHFHLIQALNSVIKKVQPDVLLSFLDGSNVLALETKLLLKPDCAFVISQRNNMSISFERRYEYKGFRRWLKMIYVRWLYPQADHIIALSHGVKADLVDNFGMPAAKITPIHNPIDIQKIVDRSTEPATFPWDSRENRIVVAVGRLFEQKGYFDLIEAYSRLEMHQPVKLAILGEGELRGELEEFIVSKGLQDDIWMPGFVANPWAYMRAADIFVLSSHWEGFGRVIVEAMACGIPVVVTDCDYGPREIISHGKNGMLVPVGDVRRLAEEIEALLEDDVKHQKLAKAGKLRASDFESSKISQQYGQVLFDAWKTINKNAN
jgi:glycosyltransferase involved in cell wall biosynthesis